MSLHVLNPIHFSDWSMTILRDSGVDKGSTKLYTEMLCIRLMRVSSITQYGFLVGTSVSIVTVYVLNLFWLG